MAGPRHLLRLDEREPPTLLISRLLRTMDNGRWTRVTRAREASFRFAMRERA
jgi:hypothetical protein